MIQVRKYFKNLSSVRIKYKHFEIEIDNNILPWFSRGFRDKIHNIKKRINTFLKNLKAHKLIQF